MNTAHYRNTPYLYRKPQGWKKGIPSMHVGTYSLHEQLICTKAGTVTTGTVTRIHAQGQLGKVNGQSVKKVGPAWFYI